MKRLVRCTVGYLFSATGVTSLVRNRWPQPGALILMFHRVRDDDDSFFKGVRIKQFDRQMRYLRRHYHPIALSDLVDHIQQQRPIPPNSVVITFDDGFRDNYSHAFPILKKHDIPATVFLVTNSIETGELPWSQRIGFILQRTNQLEVSLDELLGQSFPLRTKRQRIAVLQTLRGLRRSLSFENVQQLPELLSHRCKVMPPRDQMLTWRQIREMDQHRIEFGAHTVHHPLLAYVPLDIAKKELEESKSTIECNVARQVRHFAFPGGSYSNPLITMAKDIGFESFFRKGQRQEVNDHQSDPHALRRWGASLDPTPVMAAETAGILECFRGLTRRQFSGNTRIQ